VPSKTTDVNERKTLRLELKADQEGAFSAVFATFDVIDADQDVTRPGAFKSGAPVIVGSWGHKTWELPVGRGAIKQTDNEAIVDGEFFLDTTFGRDTYQTVKNLGELQEWSYVYRVKRQSFGEHEGRDVRFIEELDVFSVDPVLKGAGVDTRTVDIKGMESGLTFVEHGERISELVGEYVGRVKARADLRATEGRALSGDNLERLSGLAEALKSTTDDLERLLAETADPKEDGALVAQFLRYQQLRARQSGAA
jgi:hypothetical protein